MAKWAQGTASNVHPDLRVGSKSPIPMHELIRRSMDPLRDDALIYEHFLKESGVPVRKDIYAGLPHAGADFMPMLSKSKQAAQDLKSGLRWLFDQTA